MKQSVQIPKKQIKSSKVHTTRPGVRVAVRGRKPFVLENLLTDFNGTLALDGRLLPEVRHCIDRLSQIMNVFVLTSDTLGTASDELSNLPVKLVKLGSGKEKLKFIKNLGAKTSVAIGNGSNDAPMLKAARVSIVVVGPEGATRKSLLSAEIVTREIVEALELLLFPDRLASTLNAISVSLDAHYGTVISHRSGETWDDFISDLAVGTGTLQIKSGAPVRGERVAKYNRLMAIEDELGSHVKFAGLEPFSRFGKKN